MDWSLKTLKKFHSGMNSEIKKFVSSFRVARFATSDQNAQPHVIPICFEIGNDLNIYSAIDSKPKSGDFNTLKRVKNIRKNPKVSVLFDEYTEDWEQLAYVLIRGEARVETGGIEREYGEDLLRDKYRQYGDYLMPGCPVIVISPKNIYSWGNI